MTECPMAPLGIKDASGAFSPAREGGVRRLYVTETLIPALTGGAESRRPQPGSVIDFVQFRLTGGLNRGVFNRVPGYE